ncbi:hypothetical protein HCQ94_00055 [Actinomyces sp. zg-332]|uniref:DUF6678 family protein n=1 Tax=Actinomyces sp. zg-332 TaxID=2708340 RepID=UPI0018C3324A|nr:DUF6678 family protein [Actinomyces sp. zg-332]QPK94154.1 hypothetical protein HCQ94_00055 [Actinomyces sp. zg-332]
MKSEREKVLAIISERNLCSYMNNTKWNELSQAMLEEMPFPPPYVVKYLFEDENSVPKLEDDDSNFGTWYRCDCCCFPNGTISIEWIKIRPRYLKHIGTLVESELVDASKKLQEILNKYNINYEVENNTYCIYGYK